MSTYVLFGYVLVGFVVGCGAISAREQCTTLAAVLFAFLWPVGALWIIGRAIAREVWS